MTNSPHSRLTRTLARSLPKEDFLKQAAQFHDEVNASRRPGRPLKQDAIDRVIRQIVSQHTGYQKPAWTMSRWYKEIHTRLPPSRVSEKSRRTTYRKYLREWLKGKTGILPFHLFPNGVVQQLLPEERQQRQHWRARAFADTIYEELRRNPSAEKNTISLRTIKKREENLLIRHGLRPRV